MLKRALQLILVLLISACGSSLTVTQLPQQKVESQLFTLEQLSPKTEKSLLVVQFEKEQWRWLQTDPLGAPIARLVLTKNGWQNDGFVMPNAQAKQLFSAIATFQNQNLSLFKFSQIEQLAATKSYYIQGKNVWQIRPKNKGAEIKLNDHSQWYIEPIE